MSAPSDYAELVERLKAKLYFSDRLIAAADEADRDLIIRYRAERSEAATALASLSERPTVERLREVEAEVERLKAVERDTCGDKASCSYVLGEWEAALQQERAAREAAEAKLAEARPEGWVLVPEEPTEAMLDAYWHQCGESKEMRARIHSHAARYYRVMIGARALSLKHDGEPK